MDKTRPIITLLGSGGGVARAILALLNQSFQDFNDPIHAAIRDCRMHLIDRKQRSMAYYESFMPDLAPAAVLHQFDLNKPDKLRRHLIRTKTTLVIDVSWADTVRMLECCNELGVLYINTALENEAVDDNEELEGFTLLERYRIFERHRSRFANTKAIVGSGMNPGVVQWMALELMKRHPGEQPLACYIVERDSSLFRDRSLLRERTIYSTWSPECFLDEAIANYPMFVSRHTPLILYHDVYELEFRVRLGDDAFYGCLMPHEEVLTLGQAFDMETGFIYRVSDFMTETIRARLDNPAELWSWNHETLDPANGEMEGSDKVGVLLVYADKERYMYNEMRTADVFPRYRTNATYFQVACGLYGGLCSLLLDAIPKGIYYVDELLLRTESRYGQYVGHYMQVFVTGDNDASDGLLLDRMRKEE